MLQTEEEKREKRTMISGKAKVCGLIANPVGHSMSPLMQNFYAEQAGVDFAYVPFQVSEGTLKEAVRGAYALNLTGLNVTVPYKQQVMSYLSEIDEAAAAIGAVNTLVRTEDGFKGYNTDAEGLFRAMKEEGISIKGQSCILIGAGGAAKAAAYLLMREGADVVYLLNRNVERAEVLAAELNQRFGSERMIPMALADYGKLPEDSYLAIQSTSVGMHPDVGQAPIEDPEFYRMIHTGVDIIYTPMETQFMRLLSEAGGRAVNGLTMLLYQGIEAFETWNPGVHVSAQTIAEAKALMIARLKG